MLLCCTSLFLLFLLVGLVGVWMGTLLLLKNENKRKRNR